MYEGACGVPHRASLGNEGTRKLAAPAAEVERYGADFLLLSVANATLGAPACTIRLAK